MTIDLTDVARKLEKCISVSVEGDMCPGPFEVRALARDYMKLVEARKLEIPPAHPMTEPEPVKHTIHWVTVLNWMTLILVIISLLIQLR